VWVSWSAAALHADLLFFTVLSKTDLRVRLFLASRFSILWT